MRDKATNIMRNFPSASSESQNTELFHRSDDKGIERAAEEKVKEAVSLDVYWQYLIKEGTTMAALLVSGSIAILPDGKRLLIINKSKQSLILHGISSVNQDAI